MVIGLAILKQGLVFFWSVWITLAFVTNGFDGLKVAGVLPDGWKFASGNYAYIDDATDKYAVPGWLTGLLFAGVLVWEGLAVVLYWIGFSSYVGDGGLGGITTALAVTIALWAAFMIADEVFRIYEQQTTHVLLFISQMVTLLALYVLPG
jgi:hypothetical protein